VRGDVVALLGCDGLGMITREDARSAISSATPHDRSTTHHDRLDG
jgi:hypothetical protein